MPPDHINIQNPQYLSADGNNYRTALEIAKLQLELKQLRTWHDMAVGNLEAIFNRIERGDNAELHYADGRVFVITGKERGN